MNRWRRQRVTPSHSALTLLELMLAMMLMAVILSVTWSLLGIFSERLETSQRQVEQWQLIRSLQQVLDSDLRSCEAVLPRGERPMLPDAERPSLMDRLMTPDSPASTSADSASAGAASVSAASAAPTAASVSASSALSNTDVVVRGAWLEPDSFLLGTSQALVFDFVPPASPVGPRRSSEDIPLDSAVIPDTVRRVVYVFHDPLAARRMDRPAGLIRCELTMRQLTVLRQVGGGEADLLTFLRPEIDRLSRPEDDQPTSTSGADAFPTGDERRLTPDSDRSLSALHDPLSRDPEQDLQLGQYLDYVPELATFLLRYYDGTTWQEQWDSREQQGLPVAVEMRFQLTSEVRLASGTSAEVEGEFDGALGGEASTNTPTSAITSGSSAGIEPLDDRLRSAQTRPPEDHRFLIFLRPASGNVPRSSADATGNLMNVEEPRGPQPSGDGGLR